ncbi:YktB family protein [Aquibacillus salsiterrae]|uniref:UPF0637 protein NC799_06300 n=1 Tax=Aquibacillus salsiterrae TaxID=2950439 RepID=A0A9X3WBG1_9BACI|nr:DUF1054 domain-containing protein [Aquibacillus salsiterrae]MDC3416525.1 DUF1054 domain-containing protein [Aquibacillus salsiterrae]
MAFNGFTQEDFDTFLIEGLDERMEAIRSRIQPKFKMIGDELVQHLSSSLGDELYLHIARHARRSVNPPKDTWLAIAENKRGYKKHPHFQVGLFDDHLFIWFALIYELPNKSEIAQRFINELGSLKQLPSDFVFSLDHTKKGSFPVTSLEFNHLERFRDVKKAEFLIGRHVAATNKLITNGEELLKHIKDTFDHLLPFYKQALKSD